MTQIIKKNFLLIITLMIFLLARLPFWSLTIDDVYIHLQFARNLAFGQGWSFNPGLETNGSTSPLWTLILSTPFFFQATPESALLFTKILTLILGGSAVYLFWQIIKKITNSEAITFLITTAMAANIFLSMWSISGMEVTLTTFLLILAIFLLVCQKSRFYLGLVLGLNILTRPESIFFAFLVLVYLLIKKEGGKSVSQTLGGLILPPLIWGVYSLRVFATIWPNSFIAKTKTGLNYQSSVIIPFLIYTAKMVTFVLIVPLIVEIILLIHTVYIILKSKISLAGPVALFPRPTSSLRSADYGRSTGVPQSASPANLSTSQINNQSNWSRGIFWLMIVYVIVHLLFYYLTGTSLLARYVIVVLPAVLLALVVIYSRNDRIRSLSQTTVGGLIILILMVQASIGYYGYRMEIKTGNWNSVPALTDVADWLKENTGQFDRIATDDVGLIGFYSERFIIDLEGLVTPELLRSLEQENRFQDLMALKPDYLIISRPEYAQDILEPLKGKLTKVYTRQANTQSSLDTASREYVVYKIAN